MENSDKMRKYALTLSLKRLNIDKIYDIAQARGMPNRSVAADYLIHMGYLYVTQVLPSQEAHQREQLFDYLIKQEREEHWAKTQKRDKFGRFKKG